MISVPPSLSTDDDVIDVDALSFEEDTVDEDDCDWVPSDTVTAEDQSSTLTE